MERANHTVSPSFRPKRNSRIKNAQLGSHSDIENTSLPMKSENTKKKNTRRLIKCLSDYDNLNRSSLTPGVFAKQTLTKEKKNTRKPHNLDFLPKIDMGDRSKENCSLNQNHREKLDSKTIILGNYTDLNKISQKNKDDQTSCKKSYLNNFIVTNLDNDNFDVPSLSGNKEESPDEVVFKPRHKKDKPISALANGSTSECASVKRSATKSLVNKTTKNISFTRSALKIHSCPNKSISYNTFNKDDDVEHSATKSPVKKSNRKLNFTKKSMSLHKTSTDAKNDENINPQAHQTYRKSVRFATTPQENSKKRRTFELENSTFDVSLLPDADEAYVKKRSYQKSPHTKKIKNFVEPEDSLIEFEKLEANISNNCINNKTELPKRSLILQDNHLLEALHSTESYPICSIQKSTDCSTSIINLVTPSPEKRVHCTVGNNCDQNVSGSARKRWSKPADLSFLDSFEYLHNVSTPWKNQTVSSSSEDNELNNTFPKAPDNKDKSKKSKKSIVSFKSPVVKTIHSATSSTPLIKQKGFLQDVLLKDKSKIVNKNKNSVLKSVTKTKMPNFAQIHQKAFQKMENIKEMSERKAARAQLLLSGHKPISSNTVQVKSPKMKRMLNYSPKKPLTPRFTPLTNSTKINTPKLTVKVMTTVDVIQPSTSNPKTSRLPKPVQRKMENSKTSKIPQPINRKFYSKGNCISKYGFKVGQEKSFQNTKENQIKAVANKRHIPNDPIKKARSTINEVRSNRRFELLMQMRKKQK